MRERAHSMNIQAIVMYCSQARWRERTGLAWEEHSHESVQTGWLVFEEVLMVGKRSSRS